MLDTPLALAERRRIAGDSEMVRSWHLVFCRPGETESNWERVLSADPERVAWQLQFSRASVGIVGLLGWLEVRIGHNRVRQQAYESVQLHAEGMVLGVTVERDLTLAVEDVQVRYHAVTVTDETNCGIGVMAVRRIRASGEEGG